MTIAFRLVAILCAALALVGCGYDASYRYKLTLSLDTPDGVKTASTVVEIGYWKVSFPAHGWPNEVTGQALYLDLGPSRRPLVALLSRIVRVDEAATRHFAPWAQDDPTGVFADACLGGSEGRDPVELARLINERCRRSLPITTADLPDLVTFADVNRPQSLLLVDPNNLEATLGPNVSWQSMTMEATDEPLTQGIEKHLPWVNLKEFPALIVVPGLFLGNGANATLHHWDFREDK